MVTFSIIIVVLCNYIYSTAIDMVNNKSVEKIGTLSPFFLLKIMCNSIIIIFYIVNLNYYNNCVVFLERILLECPS